MAAKPKRARNEYVGWRVPACHRDADARQARRCVNLACVPDVPCNVYSISAAAYYAASAAGIKPQAVIELRACAYRGETLVKFNGALLAVERVERTPDNVRLTLVERVGDREQG